MSDDRNSSNETSDADGIRTLATQGSITFFGSILVKALNFLFLVVITNLVAPSTFGIFTLSLSIILFAKSVSDLSVHRSIDYFIPQFVDEGEYGKARFVLGSTIVISLVGTGIASAFLLGGVSTIADVFNEPKLASILPILVFAIPFLAFRDVTIQFFIALKELKYRVYLQNILLPGVKLLVTLSLLYAGFELFALLIGYIFSVVVVAVMSVLLLSRRITWSGQPFIERVPTRDLLSYSLPLVFAGVIYTTISQIDFFVIGYVGQTNSEDLAVYKVATQLGNNLLIFLTSLAPVFKPMVTEAQDDSKLLNSRYTLAARWILLLTLPVAVTLALAPGVYLSLLFTPQYAAGGGALIVLILGYLINASVGPEGMVLEGLGYTRLTLLNTVVMLGVNTLLDLLLIPHFGILGAAIGTTVGMTCAVMAGVLQLRYFQGILPFNNNSLWVLLSAIPSLTVGWIAVHAISSQLTIALILPFIVLVSYVGSLRVTNAFGKEDLLVADLLEQRLGVDLFSRIISSE